MYITIETKEAGRIEYNGFLFPHEYSGGYECGKRNLLYPMWATSFVSIELYLIHSYTIINFMTSSRSTTVSYIN
jgi:hypothetical protein